MSIEGAIAAAIDARDGRVVHAEITATRRVPLAAALRGKRAVDAVALMPLVFPSCGVAHAAAAAAAVESATGIGDDVSASRRAARARLRALLVASEALEGHAWSALVAWPALVGAPAELERVRMLRVATASFRATIDPERLAMRIGHEPHMPGRHALDEALERLELATSAITGALPNDTGDLTGWARTSPAPAARLVLELALAANAGLGASDVAGLPDLSPAWFASRLAANPAFGERPTVDGAPHEAGAIAHPSAHPLVSSVVERHGRGALARVVARLVELASMPARLRALARAEGPAPHLAEAGCGIADTARGRLAHWAQIDQGMVIDWRFVAPTEWTFHPDGAFVRGLSRTAAPRPDLERAVALHVAALDPCVPCAVAFREAPETLEVR